jgi:hypothetical protein
VSAFQTIERAVVLSKLGTVTERGTTLLNTVVQGREGRVGIVIVEFKFLPSSFVDDCVADFKRITRTTGRSRRKEEEKR